MATNRSFLGVRSGNGRAQLDTAGYRWLRHRLAGVRSRPSDRYGTDLLTLTSVPAHPPTRTFGSRCGLNSAATGKGLPERGGAAVAKSDRISRITTPPRPRRLLLAMLTLVFTVSAVACSDHNAASPTTTSEPGRSSTTSSTTTTTVDATEATTSSTASTPAGTTVEDEITARYIGYWNARFAANSDTPNPNDPALREYATGEQLDAVVAETQRNLDEGLAFRRAPSPANVQRVKVVSADGDHAVVQECVVSDGVIVRRDTGEIVNDDVATHNVRGELARVDGVWRVSSAQLVQRWEGVAGCALGS